MSSKCYRSIHCIELLYFATPPDSCPFPEKEAKKLALSQFFMILNNPHAGGIFSSRPGREDTDLSKLETQYLWVNLWLIQTKWFYKDKIQ